MKTYNKESNRSFNAAARKSMNAEAAKATASANSSEIEKKVKEILLLNKKTLGDSKRTLILMSEVMIDLLRKSKFLTPEDFQTIIRWSENKGTKKRVAEATIKSLIEGREVGLKDLDPAGRLSLRVRNLVEPILPLLTLSDGILNDRTVWAALMRMSLAADDSVETIKRRWSKAWEREHPREDYEDYDEE